MQTCIGTCVCIRNTYERSTLRCCIFSWTLTLTLGQQSAVGSSTEPCQQCETRSNSPRGRSSFQSLLWFHPGCQKQNRIQKRLLAIKVYKCLFLCQIMQGIYQRDNFTWRLYFFLDFVISFIFDPCLLSMVRFLNISVWN